MTLNLGYAVSTVRNVVGQFQLDQLLSQTVQINQQIKTVIDAHTEPWGGRSNSCRN